MYRYLQPPSEWVPCALESRELLSLCLKKLKGLNRVKLVDAGFVWTEPHSKRIKVHSLIHNILSPITFSCMSFTRRILAMDWTGGM
jgi:NMD protein affecting ribosome stability and mRNA decay